MICAKCGIKTSRGHVLTAPFVYWQKDTNKMQGLSVCNSCYPVVEEMIRNGEQPTFLKPPDTAKNILDEP
jgi:hypothetical protein